MRYHSNNINNEMNNLSLNVYLFPSWRLYILFYTKNYNSWYNRDRFHHFHMGHFHIRCHLLTVSAKLYFFIFTLDVLTYLTISSCKSRSTSTVIEVDVIVASSGVLTRVTFTFVYIYTRKMWLLRQLVCKHLYGWSMITCYIEFLNKLHYLILECIKLILTDGKILLQ